MFVNVLPAATFAVLVGPLRRLGSAFLRWTALRWTLCRRLLERLRLRGLFPINVCLRSTTAAFAASRAVFRPSGSIQAFQGRDHVPQVSVFARSEIYIYLYVKRGSVRPLYSFISFALKSAVFFYVKRGSVWPLFSLFLCEVGSALPLFFFCRRYIFMSILSCGSPPGPALGGAM